MGQVLKSEVEGAILASALEIFARDGFEGATMGTIAANAGISTGNVYRYFPGKDALFATVLPDSFVASLRRLIRKRMASLDGVGDFRRLAPSAPFFARSEELLGFCLQERRRIIILLGGARGTFHEGFVDDLSRMMIRETCHHFRGLNPDLRVTRTMRFALEQIYRQLARVTREVLASFPDPAEARQALEDYLRYHLAGLNHLFPH